MNMLRELAEGEALSIAMIEAEWSGDCGCATPGELLCWH